ncbi:MAG: MBOAT family protein [Bdellovibrionales bacterium]
MNFSSSAFLLLAGFAVFLRQLTLRWPGLLNAVLLTTSLIFFGWANPEYLVLLLAAIFMNFTIARQISSYDRENLNRHFLLFIAIFFNLGTMALFKFWPAVSYLLKGVGQFQLQTKSMDLLIPVGLSFFLLETMGYVSDVYWGRTKPQKNLVSFAVYVSFFPKIICGPLVSAEDFFAQLGRRPKLTVAHIANNLFLILSGVFLRVVLASSFERETAVYWIPGHLSFDHALVSWMTLWIFYWEIFSDLFGYSLIAIGVAGLLGFSLPASFDFPYLATSLKDFWQSWNMTLTSWGKRHFIEPLANLAGNGFGNRIKIICLGFVLYGLWHGLKWPAFFWGLWQGLFLVLELRGNPRRLGALGQVLGWAKVQIIVLFGWLLLRSDNFENVAYHLKNIAFGNYSFEPLRGHIWNYYFLQPMILSGLLVLAHARILLARRAKLKVGPIEKAAYAGIMAYLTLTAYGKSFPVYYFRF